ncbi:hypothetical protein Dred_0792 [Desulforamulus reducens MI-1]|uniref:Uncharacterized protein n=2 Tax=Desulforamulus TaxID=2916693 RepID=A4J2M7_DESRM|nr:hypothetical protein Dred_0792 [Desulforamulus reducens MI-1]
MGIQSRISTTEAMDYIRGKALTPETAEKVRISSELARGLAVEWATFDGEDKEDYMKRLSVYLNEGHVDPPAGMQKCLSANVLSSKQVPGEEDHYRVQVLLHVSKLVKIPESKAYGISEARRVAISEPDKSTNERTLTTWQEEVLNTEVSVKVLKDEAFVIGLPVIIPIQKSAGVATDKYIDSEEAPKDFTIFIQQALTMYCEGNDMTNYVVPGANVTYLGGYKIKNVAVTNFSQREKTAKAVVYVTVSSEGLDEIQMSMVIEAEKKDRWLLSRIGSW